MVIILCYVRLSEIPNGILKFIEKKYWTVRYESLSAWNLDVSEKRNISP